MDENLRPILLKNSANYINKTYITQQSIIHHQILKLNGFSPFYLLYCPYQNSPWINLDLGICEQYNDNRKQELLPFFDQVYRKMSEQAEHPLSKCRENLQDPPDLQEKTSLYEER